MARPTFGSALSKASCPPRTARSPCGMVKGVVPVRPSPARFGRTTFKGWIRATLYGLAVVEQCDLINVVRVRRRLPALQSSNRSPDARGDGMEQRLNMADRLHAGKYSFAPRRARSGPVPLPRPVASRPNSSGIRNMGRAERPPLQIAQALTCQRFVARQPIPFPRCTPQTGLT